jgi:hypothetical protein
MQGRQFCSGLGRACSIGEGISMLKEGDIILIAHRRLFENDEVRFFIGCVDEYENGIVKVTGRSYIRDVIGGTIVEKAEKRTKLLSLSAGTFFFYQLPQGLTLDALKFEDKEGSLLLTDGKDFTMNLAEHTHGGRA